MKAKITEVTVERLYNLENYNTLRLGLKAIPAPGEDVQKLVGEMSAELTRLRSIAIKEGRPKV